MLPFHLIISLIVVFSRLIVVFSSSLVAMWVSLEINTISLIPLMKSKGGSKYFLAQSVGSAMILSGCALNLEWLVFLGAIVKAGIGPVHAWFPQVMEHLSWKLCLVLSTWQKIGPLVVMISRARSSLVLLLGCFSLVLGSVGAIKQTRLRNIMAYSSITHMGWVLCGFLIRGSMAFIYFFVYCLTSFFVIIKLSNNRRLSVFKRDLRLILIIFSISGLPPFVGFFPKI